MVVWTGIWYWYLTGHAPINEATWYWCYGFLLTGFALLIIGLAIGRIGRSARHAELPPEEVTRTEAQIDQNAAARAPMVAANPAAPAPSPNGQGAPAVSQVAGTIPVATVAPTVPQQPTAVAHR
jgi:hypothetical protein